MDSSNGGSGAPPGDRSVHSASSQQLLGEGIIEGMAAEAAGAVEDAASHTPAAKKKRRKKKGATQGPRPVEDNNVESGMQVQPLPPVEPMTAQQMGEFHLEPVIGHMDRLHLRQTPQVETTVSPLMMISDLSWGLRNMWRASSPHQLQLL